MTSSRWTSRITTSARLIPRSLRSRCAHHCTPCTHTHPCAAREPIHIPMLCVSRCCKACCCRTIRSQRSVKPSLHSRSSLGPSRPATPLLGLIVAFRLHLHNNLITEVPAFAMMPCLLDLSLSNNKIVELPTEISNLHQVSCCCLHPVTWQCCSCNCWRWTAMRSQGFLLDSAHCNTCPSCRQAVSACMNAAVETERCAQLQKNALKRLGDEHVVGLTTLRVSGGSPACRGTEAVCTGAGLILQPARKPSR